MRDKWQVAERRRVGHWKSTAWGVVGENRKEQAQHVGGQTLIHVPSVAILTHGGA